MRLIDADALVETMKADEPEVWMQDDYMFGQHDQYLVDLTTVEAMPTVQGWISVKDRLPVRPPDVCGLLVRRQWYLVALESGTVLTLSYEFDEDRWQGVGSPVTHWMPLPAPPKEGDVECA